jgi:serine phosphatase RsbU (regulator of sigma subunit)
MAEENYEEETYNFNKNDSFFIYTDGLIETEIEGISERLISEKLKELEIEEVNLDIRKILKKTYDEENPFEDDITYLICKKTGDD